jgi:hypothetical protein
MVNVMAGKGKRFMFHGAFGSKRAAVEKERATAGAFIQKRGARWYVLTRRSQEDPPRQRLTIGKWLRGAGDGINRVVLKG